MEKKKSILFWFMVGLIVLSVSTLFYKSVVLQDFDLVTIDFEEEEVSENIEE